MITVRSYHNTEVFGEDYFKVRDFLIARGYCEFTFARFDWMITHPNLKREKLQKIGIWEDGEKTVGVCIFDCAPGDTFCIALPGYEHIKADMIEYASKNLRGDDGSFGIMISDSDALFQNIAAQKGFFATGEREYDAVFYTESTGVSYTLPEGFRITDMNESFDLYKYGEALWKGFNHELSGEGKFEYNAVPEGHSQELVMKRPNCNLSLKIAAEAPDGSFASYCGMWYDKQSGYAVIEPVATVPEYRKMGLGRAVVLEGIKRVRDMGAKLAFVGSAQQFYYSIGLRPYASATKWCKKPVTQK